MQDQTSVTEQHYTTDELHNPKNIEEYTKSPSRIANASLKTGSSFNYLINKNKKFDTPRERGKMILLINKKGENTWTK